MRIRVLSLVLVMAAVFGCSSPTVGERKVAEASPALATPGCTSAETDDDGLTVCLIYLTVSDGVIKLDPEDLVVDSTVFALHERIVWVIRTAGYSFKDDSAVHLKSGHGSFSHAEKKTDQRFRLTVLTTVFAGGICQNYGITIYDAAGHAISYDPTISNSYGFQGLKAGMVCK